MTRKFVGRLVMTGAVSTAVGLSPVAALAQVSIPCPAVGAPACSTFNIPIAVSTASGVQSAPVTNSGNSGPSFVVSAPQQTVASSAAAQVNSQNGSFNGNGVGGGRVFVPSATLMAGGVANTGGA